MPDLTVTLPPFNATAIKLFVEFWDSATFGAFSQALPLLAVVSVYLKTRSIGMSLLTLILVSTLLKNLALTALGVGLGLAYLIYRAVWRD